jgi:hypothetical protein
MKTALQTFLQQLDEIQEEYEGLGDTNVRDHMAKDIWRGFLVPTTGFKPSGEYGLKPAANKKIAKAIAAFCKAAKTAARKQGLNTFQQRVAAFQDPSVRTASGADYNDFFGQISPKAYNQHGNRKDGRKPAVQNYHPLAYTFTFAGTIEEIFEHLKSHSKKWEWYLNRNYRVPFIDGQFNKGVWIKIDALKKPRSAFGVKMVDQFERNLHPPAKQLIAILKRIGAKGIKKTPAT